METVRTLCAGGVVLNALGEVALVASGHDNFWGFPKGHVDEGEDKLTAARREIGEETGVDELELVMPLPVYERYKANQKHEDDLSELKETYMFLFRTAQETLAPRDEWNPEAAWFSLDAVQDKLSHRKDKEWWITVKELIRSSK